MEHQPSTLSNQPRPSKQFTVISWALVAAWACLIFFMSSNTGTGLIAIACASLYGVSDEVHQLFVPERMCDPVDWMVDTAGSALGSGITYAVLRKRDARS